MKSDKQRPSRRGDLAAFALLGQVGLLIAGGAALGAAIGLFIDHQLGSSPIATIIGLLLGLAAGIYGVYRLVSNLE
jgi:ATP synthase protein I